MTARALIVIEAREWIGTPFHHGQSLKGIGSDCIGLVRGIARKFWPLLAATFDNDIRFKGYAPTPDPDQLLLGCHEYLDEIPVSRARLGDILQYTFAREPMHFAIVSREDPRYVIHGYQRAKGVVENGATATFWKVQRAFAFRGVE